MPNAATTIREGTGNAESRPSAAQARDRVTTVDSVRALALFGVVAINMQDISGLTFMSPAVLDTVQTGMDRAAATLLDAFVDNKALSAFSFLFGLSFTLLLEGSRRRGEPFVPLYLRRLMFLGGFGLLNAAFFYWGDILTTYAVFGVLLLPALWLPQKAILALAALLTLGVPLALGVAGVIRGPGAPIGTDVEAIGAFTEPSLWATVVYNVERFIAAVRAHSALGGWNYANIIGLFLLGMWTGRAGVARDLEGHRPLLKAVFAIALPLGFVLALGEALVPRGNPLSTALLAGTPILAVGYLAAATLLLERARARPIRNALAPAGQMALTLYLLSGLGGEIVFYGWGFGLLGGVGTAGVVLVAAGIYLLLLVFGHLWLMRFRYGPFEWLWRCLTHMRRQPILR